ncbi:MAG TPA: RNA polymerase sigma-54 factor, partial [Chitinophagaceae bacterium]|nr:RNA polymerase sigma-54 factor [Chitinophagaceae bacterium]
MKLLQVPTANLEDRIKEELEENPALEQVDDAYDNDYNDEFKDEFESNNEEEVLDGSEDEYENIDISEYVSDSDDDIADYKTRDENYGDTEENKIIPIKNEQS